MLAHASIVGPLTQLLPSVCTLNVVCHCDCGCASVDFALHGQAPPYRILADGTGRTPRGAEVGVIVWGSADAVTGLEIVGHYPHTIGLPTIDSLQAG
jgi:hypothetical protein